MLRDLLCCSSLITNLIAKQLVSNGREFILPCFNRFFQRFKCCSVPFLCHRNGAKIDIGLKFVCNGAVVILTDIQLPCNLITLFTALKAFSHHIGVSISFCVELGQLIERRTACLHLAEITFLYISGNSLR